MELTKRRSYIFLGIGLFFTFFMPIVNFYAQLAFLIPFIVTVYYQKSYLASLWTAFACGLLLDILSFTSKLGVTGLSYTITTAILYKYRMHFFGDNQSTLPIMTFLFVFISTLFLWMLSYVFEPHFKFVLMPFLSELTLLPLLNAIYAYIIFIFPLSMIHNFYIKKKA